MTGKKYADAAKRFDGDQLFSAVEALDLVRSLAPAKFDETVEMVVRLGVDPRKAAGVEKGSAEPHREKVGTVTRAQVREIAETKMPDLNALDIEGAMKVVEGTARSMGIVVSG